VFVCVCCSVVICSWSVGDWQVTLSSPVNITFSDRVGLYTSSARQLAIPFEHDHTASVYYSTDVIANNVFRPSRRITVDDARWSRSFRQHVVFCRTPGRRRPVSPSTRQAGVHCLVSTQPAGCPRGPPGVHKAHGVLFSV